MEIKEIFAYHPWDFVSGLQAAILEGYRISDLNAHMPQIYQGQLSIVVVKPELKEESEVVVLAEVLDNRIAAQEEAKQALVEQFGEENQGAAPVPEVPKRAGRPKAQ